MDDYQKTVATMQELDLFRDWPDLQEIFSGAASRSPKAWRLPLIACEAVGGERWNAVPAMAAIACAQISIILIDDMLDQDPRGEYRHRGEGGTANLALAFQAAGLEAIACSKLQPNIKLAALGCLNQMMLTTALGQHLDVQNLKDEAAYWELVRTKSSPFFGAAFQVGAFYGGASLETAAQLARLGRVYGEMIQIHDDLNDSMSVPANPDWTQGRSPLPMLFAQTVSHPEKARFVQLRQAMPDEAALSEAQQILVRCGAISYAVDVLLRKYETVMEMIRSIALPRTGVLEGLLKEIVDPVLKLFESIGVQESGQILLQPPSLEA